MNFQFCSDCLSDSDCATGAVCLSGECSCNSNIPVLVGGIASNTSATCVECSSSDSSECTSIEVCDTVSNICVGEYTSNHQYLIIICLIIYLYFSFFLFIFN